MMKTTSLFFFLLVCAPLSLAWHDFTNPNFHCWPDSASASSQDTMDCDGIHFEWIVAPPDEITADEGFSVTYSLTVDDDEFWDWAVNLADYNVFEDVGTSITTAAEAEDWCKNTTCPAQLTDVNEETCCIWHVNVHSCPVSDSPYCGPWIQPSGSTYTHSDVLWGQLQEANFTSEINGLHEEGLTQIIAHIKIASFQVALHHDIRVTPRAECGNNDCESDEGENCDTCPADCGKCPLQGWAIALIAAIAAAIVLGIAGVVLFFVIKWRRMLWDESWIIKYEEMSAAGNRRALMGSAISVANSSKGSMGGQKGAMTNMAAQAMAKQMFCKTSMYRGKTLAIKDVPKRTCPLTKQMRIEVREMRSMDHPNLVRFMGACIEVPHVCIASEYCPKGSLADVLQNEDIPLNWGFRFSMAGDVARGMAHIHHKNLTHGNLKSNNCIIDDRWTVKLTDFGLETLRAVEIDPEDEDFQEEYFFKQSKGKVYLAPEFMGQKNPQPTQAGDVYAYAIILVEIGTREDPYGDEGGPDAVEDTWKPPMPDFSDESFDDKCPSKFDYLQLIRDCWMDQPSTRPSFPEIRKALVKMNPSKLSPVDIMMAMMEKYSKHLESIVAERTQEMILEKEKADKLLYSMIPKAVADELKKGKQIKAEQYSACTIYFSDIVGFTKISGGSTAVEVIALLNKLYVCFDSIIDNYDVYKVETIGDAYMVVSGIPKPNGIRHAREICNMAIDLREACKTFVIPHKPGEALKIRIGCHSGPACAGVVGLKMPRYCLFGDTVNTSSRMESNGEEYKIHISSFTYELLKQMGGFKCELRGTIPVKGKGDMTTYWVIGRDSLAKTMSDEISEAERKISQVSNADSGYTEVTNVTKPPDSVNQSANAPPRKSTDQARPPSSKRPPSAMKDRSNSITPAGHVSPLRRAGTAGPPKAKQGWGEEKEESGLTSIA